MEKRIKRRIYKDVFYYIWLPIGLGVFQACLESFVLVKYADIFGRFADAVFALDFVAGVKEVYSFLIALGITVILVPALAFVQDVILVKNAMSHDRKVIGRFLDKKCDAVSKIEAGDMLNRVSQDPSELRIQLIMIISYALMIPFTFVYLFLNVISISLNYFLIVLGVSLTRFLVPMIIKKAEKRYHKAEKEYRSMVRSYETDISDRAHLVNLLGVKEQLIQKLDGIYHDFFCATKRKSIRLSVTVENTKSLINTGCQLLILLIGAYLAATDYISPGAVAAMMGYYSVVNQIIDKLDYIIRKAPILDNLAERLGYFYEESEVIVGEDVKEMEDLRGENLGFAWNDKSVFANVSFTVKNGDKVVVSGKNGSGKSTLMKMILGLLGEYQGKLWVNRMELSEVNIETYRNQVAYVPQNPYLFQGTVYENIEMANFNVPEEKIRNLLQEYGLSGIADRQISYGGYELSGGERQKISILRAMVKDASVIFMDEPENNLDEEALEKVEDWITTSHKTIIYISHHPKIVRCANAKIDLK